MAADWYCKIDDAVCGPFSVRDLKRMAMTGKLGRDDFIRKGESGKWTSARTVKELVFGSAKPTAKDVPKASCANSPEIAPPARNGRETDLAESVTNKGSPTLHKPCRFVELSSKIRWPFDKLPPLVYNAKLATFITEKLGHWCESDLRESEPESLFGGCEIGYEAARSRQFLGCFAAIATFVVVSPVIALVVILFGLGAADGGRRSAGFLTLAFGLGGPLSPSLWLGRFMA